MSVFNIFKKYLNKITQRKENKRQRGRKVDIERNTHKKEKSNIKIMTNKWNNDTI